MFKMLKVLFIFLIGLGLVILFMYLNYYTLIFDWLKVNCATKLAPCPPCLDYCPPQSCDCTDNNGHLLTPAPIPTELPRPKGCPVCLVPCPLLATCPPPTTQCTEAQVASYVRKCPDCVSQAGCQQAGCACKDCSGNVYHPPINPPQPPRPKGCPDCPTICIEPFQFCPFLRQCTNKQLNTYVLECPDCVPQAGCPHIGCDCVDCLGNVLTPPTNPPQPPRPDACAKCPVDCPKIAILCPATIRKCTDTQLELYVPK